MENLRPDEIQIYPAMTSSINKQPMAKVLLYPKKDALERRFDAVYGEGKWSWYFTAPGVWTLECNGTKQSVPEDPVEATKYSVNMYNKILFMRAARNLGYGRELETSPEIKIFQDDAGTYKFEPGKNNWIFKEYLKVSKIEIKEGRIVALTIVRDRDGSVVFTYVEAPGSKKASTPAATASAKTENAGDGTPLAQVGKEIAEQAEEKAKKASTRKKVEKPAIVEVSDVPMITPTAPKPAKVEKVAEETKDKEVTSEAEPEQLTFEEATPVTAETVVEENLDEGLEELIGELADELNMAEA